MKNGWKRICGKLGAVFFVLLFFLSGGKTEAAKEKIRVGYFLVSGYQEITDEGNRWGFGYDYLQEIARYTGWEYEFVDATWDECLSMLERGELDLVTCAKASPEREEKFGFSDYRMGIMYSVLSVREDNDSYCYNDFKGFDGMKVGSMKGNRDREELEKLCGQYGIRMEEKIYDTEAQMKQALYSGEVDAVVSSNQRVFENEKIIARFELGPFFCITGKDDQETLDGLNDAMKQIIIDSPYFEARLYEKYFGENTGYHIALTREEKEYVKNHAVLRMAANSDTEPLCYPEEDGYQGITIDSLSAIAREVGMEVEYVYTDSYKDAIALLQEGEVDVIGDFYYDYSWGERNGVILTRPYMDMQYVEVTKKGKLPALEELRIATCEDYFFNNMYILKHYPEENITYYRTEQECIDAVRKGQADMTFANQYTAQVLLERDRNLKLNGNTLYDSTHGVSIAVSRDNELLCLVLNKGISNMESSEIDQIMEEYMKERDTRVSLLRYIYYNSLEFILILCVFFAAVVSVLVYIMFQRKKYSRHIFELAYHDSLTGLDNIYRFEEQAEKRWLEYRGKNVFVLSLDICHFTTINETYGRNVGDLAICYVGRRLKELYGDTGLVARSKVDNFLLYGEYISKEDVLRWLERIRTKIGEFVYEGNTLYLNYNCGIVTERCTASTSIRRMIDRAEMARKAAKKERSHTRFFNSDMERQLLREKGIEDSAKDALEGGEFQVYYQPKYCMTDGRIIGAEALVRWNNRELGFMNPGEFIPVFENSGYIVELDFFVMEQVYRMVREQLDRGEQPVRISINQSRMHFAQENYIERLNALREKYRVPNEYIELELTESIFASMKDISRIVGRLKDNGYSLSVDDFGSGYSSLNMLKEIPLDTLKIDKDFLSDGGGNGRYQKVIKKVVELAEDLEMDIICEGVEKEEQAEFLKSVGCIYAQGFLYARPMPEEEFRKLIANGGKTDEKM